MMKTLVRTIALVGTVIAVLAHASAGERGEDAANTRQNESYSVDANAYIAKAKSQISQFLHDYDFHTSIYCIQLRGKEVCEKYLQILKSLDYQIIPPLEWSDSDPDLPAVREMRSNCPDIHFEIAEVILKAPWVKGSGAVVKGRSNFGLYRISDYVQAPETIYAYRFEDLYTVYEQYAYEDQKKLAHGIFELFGYPSCTLYQPQPISHGDLPGSKHLNEFIVHQGVLYFLKIQSLGDEGGKTEEAFKASLQKYAPDLKKGEASYSYVTYEQKGRE